MPDMTNMAGPGQALDVSLPTIITDFYLLRDVTGVFRSCAEMNTLKPHTGVSWLRNNYGRALAFDLDESADMNQAQTLRDDQTVITPAEVGAQIVLPGATLRRIQDPALESRVATMLNNAYNLKEDQDGAAQMSSWTSTALGSTSTIIGVGHVFAGAARLGVGNSVVNPEPAPEPWYYVGHDFQLQHLAGRLMVLTDVPTGTNVYTGVGAGATFGAGHTDGTDDIRREGIGKITKMANVTIKRDANIPVTSTPSATGGIFSGSGFIYVSEVEPRIVKDTSDVSMRDAVEVNVWGSYKFGLYRPANYGIPMIFDCTTPTA
jgi:hypothetical protein